MMGLLLRRRIAGMSWSVVRGVLILGLCFLIVNPVFVKISTTFMTEKDIFDPTVQWVPRNLSLSRVVKHYLDVAGRMNYIRAFFNSLVFSLVISTCQLVACTVVGYGLGRFEFRGRGLIFAAVVFTLVVPPQMITIPLFLNFRYFDFFGLLEGGGFNLIGTYWPFILTALTGTGARNGLFIFIARQHFRGMPRALEESAYIDGAGQFRTFLSIMLPGAGPILLVIFLFSFVWQWNDIFYTGTFMRGGLNLLPFSLRSLISTYHWSISDEFKTIVNNTGMVLFIMPLLVLYVFLQRYFVESIERTGIVG